MRAFVNTLVTKAQLLAQLQRHRDADEIVQGRYWEGGKGCAVGCSVHGNDHGLYEIRFGIPMMLARLEDRIFEGLPNEVAKEWPVRFTNSVPIGSDLSLVGWKFIHWAVSEAVRKHAKPETARQCEAAIDVLRRRAEGIPVLVKEASEAKKASAASASAAYASAAAYAAAYAAAAAAAAASAAAAAAAAAAAYAAAYAAAAAAYASAYSRSGVWNDARRKAFQAQADKLIELILQAPVPATLAS